MSEIDDLQPTFNQQIFKEPNEFSMYIETLAKRNKATCLETLIDFAESKDIDVEKLEPMISPSLKAKLFDDFVDLGMIRSQNTLTGFFSK